MKTSIITESSKNLENVDEVKILIKITNDFVYSLYKNNQKKLIKNKTKFLNELKNTILNNNPQVLNNDMKLTNTLINFIGDSVFLSNLERFNNTNEIDLKLHCLYRYVVKLTSLYDNSDEQTRQIIRDNCEYIQNSIYKDQKVKSIQYNNSHFLYYIIFLLPEFLFPSIQNFMDQIKCWCHLVDKLEESEQKDILKNSILSDVKHYFITQIDKYLNEKELFENLFHAFIKNISSIKTKNDSIYKKHNVKKFCINECANYSIKTLLNFICFIVDYLKKLTNEQ